MIVLPARSLFHIEQAHIGPRATSRFSDYVSVGGLLREIAGHLPEQLSYSCREARLEFACGQEIGRDIVAARSDLVAAGRLSASESAAIEPYRRTVIELNRFAEKRQKQAFVAEANHYLREAGATFVLRSDSIVPCYPVAPAPTKWVSVVVHQGRNGEDRAVEPAPLESGVGELRAIRPGRVREPLPAGRGFFERYGAHGTSASVILDRLAAGLPLEKRHERDAVQAQRRAQEFWWEHAFVGVADEDRTARP
jgi:hypothetical protein